MLASYHMHWCDDVGGRSGSSCVGVRAPQGILSIPPSSGPSSAEAGNTHEFSSVCAQRSASGGIQACCNSFLCCVPPRGASEMLLFCVRNFLKLLCPCMVWERLCCCYLMGYNFSYCLGCSCLMFPFQSLSQKKVVVKSVC